MTGLALWLWAGMAGLDLASVLQSLFSRPLVVGAGAGWLLGDLDGGLRIGAVLELFALDVVPVGSVRYPDFGAATAAATVVGAGQPWVTSLGWAVAVGLVLAMLAGLTLPLTRRLNARVVRIFSDRLAAGDTVAVNAVQWRCLGHDAVRSGLVAGAALGVAQLLLRVGLVPDERLGQALTMVAAAGALWAAVHGVLVTAKASSRWRWVAAGLGVGLAAVLG